MQLRRNPDSEPASGGATAGLHHLALALWQPELEKGCFLNQDIGLGSLPFGGLQSQGRFGRVQIFSSKPLRCARTPTSQNRLPHVVRSKEGGGSTQWKWFTEACHSLLPSSRQQASNPTLNLQLCACELRNRQEELEHLPLLGQIVQLQCFAGSNPETLNPLTIRNIPSVIIGTLIRSKVYSLIKGFWSLWEPHTLTSPLFIPGMWGPAP